MIENMDYNNKKILLGLSGGINSMAVLCWLIEQGCKPSELHLFYAHFKEHSPDTFQFVADEIRYARKHFEKVVVKITNNSVLEFFEKEHMIPHPTLAPCSERLKIIPMMLSGANSLFITKEFPIELFDDDWCFEIVDKHIGWHPAIYDIKDENGKRVFTHNNCLPCKNMYVKNMKDVQTYYPKYMINAKRLSHNLKAYWGRDAKDYYTEFGKEDYEASQCETCAFD
jgi:hypothetical protein